MTTHTLFIFCILLTAVIIDCREHRIPNWLVGIGLVVGLTFPLVAPTEQLAITDALSGALVGFLVLLPGYVLGKMGAGDVKLMTVCGCFLGAAGIFNAALLTFIAGGVLGVLWVLLDKLPTYYFMLATDSRYLPRFQLASKSIGQPTSVWKQRFPYAAAIAIGCLAVKFTEFSVFTG